MDEDVYEQKAYHYGELERCVMNMARVRMHTNVLYIDIVSRVFLHYLPDPFQGVLQQCPLGP